MITCQIYVQMSNSKSSFVLQLQRNHYPLRQYDVFSNEHHQVCLCRNKFTRWPFLNSVSHKTVNCTHIPCVWQSYLSSVKVPSCRHNLLLHRLMAISMSVYTIAFSNNHLLFHHFKTRVHFSHLSIWVQFRF